MSYIALARKWRPRTFCQLIGQEHINRALSNSLKLNRLHHAYLFTGTRGVGKTSIARLLAKALNCEMGISAEPCLVCDACLAIEQGRFIDLIEIDGASRTRVEDTREILENVQYAPTSGRFKIYLIDEVHMLSQHSFNALLKTLEEPPEHVKFLLATTDPQKLPMTVLSRCLQFNLKHVQVDLIAKHLEHILQDEQLTYDPDSLILLAQAARGSMRDALSLLDQIIAVSDSHVHTHDVKNSLGYTQQDYAIPLLDALARSCPEELMVISQKIASEGGHFYHVVDELLSHLHKITINQLVKPNDSLQPMDSILADLSTRLAPEDVQLFYQIAIRGRDDLQLAPSMGIGFDMMLLRMHTFKPAPKADMTVINSLKPVVVIEPTKPQPLKIEQSIEVFKPPEPDRAIQPIKDAQNPPSNDWVQVLKHLKLTGLALSAAENAEFSNKSGSEITLSVAKGHQSLFTAVVIKRIEEKLSDYYNETIKLVFNNESTHVSTPAIQREQANKTTQEEADQTLKNDAFFQQLQQKFSAELVKNSVTAMKDDL